MRVSMKTSYPDHSRGLNPQRGAPNLLRASGHSSRLVDDDDVVA